MEANETTKLEHLTKLLDDEIYIFKQLLKYEKLKNEVIINQDVKKLKNLSKDEEGFLEQVEEIEEEREDLVVKLFEEYNINSKQILTALLEHLPKDDDQYKVILNEKKDELIRNIKDLKKINTINNKLLMDSVKFFHYTISSLQGSEGITYTQNGNVPNDHEKSWLINKRA